MPQERLERFFCKEDFQNFIQIDIFILTLISNIIDIIIIIIINITLSSFPGIIELQDHYCLLLILLLISLLLAIYIHNNTS